MVLMVRHTTWPVNRCSQCKVRQHRRIALAWLVKSPNAANAIVSIVVQVKIFKRSHRNDASHAIVGNFSLFRMDIPSF
jgi:hypothetical protein